MSTAPVRQDAKFFAAVRATGVRRSPDRWFAGICGGVAERLGVDPLLVRGVLVALTVVGGLGLALYGACWLLLPDTTPDATPDGRIEAEAALRGDVSGAAWLSGLLIVADLALPRALLGIVNADWRGPGWGFLITGLVGLLGWWLLRGFTVPRTERPAPRPSFVKAVTDLVPEPQAGFGSPTERRAAARQEAREQAQEKVREAVERAREQAQEKAQGKARDAAERARARRRPGSPLLGAAAFGLALLAAGAVVVAGLVTDLAGRALPLALSAFVVVLGAGAVVAGFRGRRTALVGLAWPVAFCAVATALVPPSPNWTWQVDRTWVPTAQRTGLSAAVGHLTVDPSRLASPATSASASIAAGRLDVLVPADATVLVDVTVLAGSLRRQGAGVVEVGRGEPVATAAAGGVHLRSLFAVGPDAERLAGSVQVRGDDPDDWTVPAGTPELHAAAWAGEVRLGTAGSSTLEQP